MGCVVTPGHFEHFLELQTPLPDGPWPDARPGSAASQPAGPCRPGCSTWWPAARLWPRALASAWWSAAGPGCRRSAWCSTWWPTDSGLAGGRRCAGLVPDPGQPARLGRCACLALGRRRPCLTWWPAGSVWPRRRPGKGDQLVVGSARFGGRMLGPVCGAGHPRPASASAWPVTSWRIANLTILYTFRLMAWEKFTVRYFQNICLDMPDPTNSDTFVTRKAPPLRKVHPEIFPLCRAGLPQKKLTIAPNYMPGYAWRRRRVLTNG